MSNSLPTAPVGNIERDAVEVRNSPTSTAAMRGDAAARRPRGPFFTPQPSLPGSRVRNSLVVALLLVLATAGDTARLWGHDPGVSSSTWRIDRGRLRGTIVFAMADAGALGLAAVDDSVDLNTRATLVAKVVGVWRGDEAVAPRAVAIRLAPDDPSELQIDVLYDLDAERPPVLRWPFLQFMSWGHRHHAKLRAAGSSEAAEYLLSDPAPDVPCPGTAPPAK